MRKVSSGESWIIKLPARQNHLKSSTSRHGKKLKIDLV
jgi:hypothetical protein